MTQPRVIEVTFWHSMRRYPGYCDKISLRLSIASKDVPLFERLHALKKQEHQAIDKLNASQGGIPALWWRLCRLISKWRHVASARPACRLVKRLLRDGSHTDVVSIMENGYSKPLHILERDGVAARLREGYNISFHLFPPEKPAVVSQAA